MDRVSVLTALDPLRFKLQNASMWHSHAFVDAKKVFRGARVMVPTNRLITLDELLHLVGDQGLTLLPITVYQGALVIAYRMTGARLLKVDPSRFTAQGVPVG